MSSGVYAIMNTINGKRYVGSAVNLGHRWNQHRHGLRHGIHANGHLQRAWDKYGEAAFRFRVVEECVPKMLLDVEQRFLDELEPEYNISKVAGSSLGVKRTAETCAKLSALHSGMKYSSETRAKLSAAHIGKPKSPKHRAAISAAHMGKKMPTDGVAKSAAAHRGLHHSPEARVRMSMAQLGRPKTQEHRDAVVEGSAVGKALAILISRAAFVSGQ